MGAYFGSVARRRACPPATSRTPAETDALTAYFAWAAWATPANRPGEDYSYTNNWPYDPLAGNAPTTAAYFWSAMSLITLLGGLGAVLFFFGRFAFLGWKAATPGGHSTTAASSVETDAEPEGDRPVPRRRGGAVPRPVPLGGALAHYRVEPGAFYGFDLAKWLPYNLLRTWHLQLAVFWIATAWVAGGLFLAPLMGGGEPRGQRTGCAVLLGALAIVVFGSLFGEALGINDKLGSLWFWFGHQGSEYLDLGRFWQILLAVGLVLWLFLMFRALQARDEDARPG